MVNEASACHPTRRPTGTPPASQEEEGLGTGEVSQARKAGEESSEFCAHCKPLSRSAAPLPAPPEATLPLAHPASDPHWRALMDPCHPRTRSRVC